MNDTPESAEIQKLECPPNTEPAVRWFIFAAMTIGFSIWCFTDRRPLPEAWDLEHINQVSAYLLNNWSPAVLAPVGLIALFMGARQWTRKLVADGEGIEYGPISLAWADVKTLDATQLKDKQILCLHLADGRKVTLEAWKLKNFRELVAMVDRQLPDVERTQEEQAAI